MSNDQVQAPTIEYLGEHLSQYAFEGFIAQGGMGAVYKARQISLDRDVAIKVLPHELGEDPGFRECFAKEAKAMARLNHPNLISVFDSGDVDGMPYIVMEYIEGCSLHESAWNQLVEPSQAATIIKGICAGLAHAHQHGIVHRDIKPANILLTTNAEPKIGDFGLAHPIESDQPGLVMGTPGYTAPEIFVDPEQAGPLADIYSVGVILHQLLTGIDPTGSQSPPNQVSGDIRLDAIWRKATRANPSTRYASVAEMGADLDKWLHSKTGSILTASAAGGITPSLQPSRRGAPMVMPERKSSSAGALFKVVAIGVLVAAIWFTYGLLQEKKDPTKKNLTNVAPAEDPVAAPPTAPKPAELASTPAHIPSSPVSGDPTPSQPEPAEVAVRNVPAVDFAANVPLSKPKGPKSEPGVSLPPGDPILLERATALILDARKKRDVLLIKNAKPLQAVLREQARKAEAGDADFLNQFADACNDGWLPEPGAIELSAAVAAAYQRAKREQGTIESSHQAELARIRDFYVPKLRKAAETADSQLKPRLIAQADGASDLAAWVVKLAPEMPRQAIALAVPNRGFVGHWDVTTNTDVTQWVADANGGVTINDGKWKGKTALWKMMPNGTVEVIWPDKPRPYVISPNGNGWSGKTSFGSPMTIAPGKW